MLFSVVGETQIIGSIDIKWTICHLWVAGICRMSTAVSIKVFPWLVLTVFQSIECLKLPEKPRPNFSVVDGRKEKFGLS